MEAKEESQEEKVIREDHADKRSELEKSLEILNPRELKIIRARRLQEDPITLEVLSQELGISKERPPTENRAFAKMQKYMMMHAHKYGW